MVHVNLSFCKSRVLVAFVENAAVLVGFVVGYAIIAVFWHKILFLVYLGVVAVQVNNILVVFLVHNAPPCC